MSPYYVPVSSSNGIVPAIAVQVTDFFNNTVANNTQIITRAYSGDCSPLYPNIVGSSQVSASSGSALFTGQTATCFPQGNITLQFSTLLGNSVKVTTNTLLQFTPCVNGEYLKGGLCLLCPSNSYSLGPDQKVAIYDPEAVIPNALLPTISCKNSPANSVGAKTKGSQIWAEEGRDEY